MPSETGQASGLSDHKNSIQIDKLPPCSHKNKNISLSTDVSVKTMSGSLKSRLLTHGNTLPRGLGDQILSWTMWSLILTLQCVTDWKLWAWCCTCQYLLNILCCVAVLLTVAAVSSMALTKATASEVQERTVSVRPSLNIRVIDDSYVRQNTPWSYKTNRLAWFRDETEQTIKYFCC